MAVKGKEAALDTALIRYRVGVALIWVGVLTWPPFILMRANGLKPNILWFLPFHKRRMNAWARAVDRPITWNVGIAP